MVLAQDIRARSYGVICIPMKAIAQLATEQESARPARQQPGNVFLLLLLAITIASSVPRLILGAIQFISYDGYWHLFLARQTSWSVWWAEVRSDGHPPLWDAIQYLLTFLGTSHLVYRLQSIVPGIATVFVLGLIAHRLFRHNAAALLTAASYGFAMTNIDLTIDVRAYPLAIFFDLLAFYAFLDILDDRFSRDIPRALFRFTLFTCLGMLTEHYSILFFAGCLSVPVVYSIFHKEYRKAFERTLVRHRVAWALCVSVPVVVLGIIYRVQLRYLSAAQNHLREYYWSPDTDPSLSNFLFSRLAAEIGLFFPTPTVSLAGLTGILLIALPVIVYRLIVRRSAVKDTLRGSPAAMLLALLAGLMFASAVGRYPFGGLLRQQSIIAPFFTLTGFLFVDWILDASRRTWYRMCVVAICGLGILGTFAYYLHGYGIAREELASAEYRTFQSGFSPRVVYSDFFSTHLYFIHTHDWKWQLQRRHVQNGHVILAYDTASPAGQLRRVLRNRDDWNFKLSEPGMYRDLAGTLKSARLQSATLFWVKQVGTKCIPAACLGEEEKFRAAADAAGLKYGSSFYDGTQAYIELSIGSIDPSMQPVRAIRLGDVAAEPHLGEGWFHAEPGVRWMGETSSVEALGPLTGGDDLVVRTFWVAKLLAGGPVRVYAGINGKELAPIAVSGAEGFRDLRWPVPKSAADSRAIELTLRVDKAREYPGDGRVLGMAVNSISLEETRAAAH